MIPNVVRLVHVLNALWKVVGALSDDYFITRYGSVLWGVKIE
jgi:hypothetical protein